MKVKKFALTAGIALAFTTTYGQPTINPNVAIIWNKELINITAHNDLVTSIGDYAFVSENEIAFIESDVTEITRLVVYNIVTKTAVKTIELNSSASFLKFTNNTFYVLSLDNMSSYNREGVLIKSIDYSIPIEVSFAIEDLVVINNTPYIHLADGATYEINEQEGVTLISDAYWNFKNTTLKTEVLNNKEFSITFDKNRNYTTHTIDATSWNLVAGMDLTVVKLIDADANKAYLDVEFANDVNGRDPMRFFVVINNDGNILSHTQIPFVYSTYIHNPFKLVDGKSIYLLSAADGLYLYNLTSNNSVITLPENCPTRLHFNDNLLPEDYDGFVEQNATDRFNNNVVSITRQNIINMAYKLRDISWTAASFNLHPSCGKISGAYFRTPAWVTKGSHKSIPYSWGGFTSYSDFNPSNGSYTGNCAKNSGSIGCNAGKNTYVQGNSNAQIIGLDCSGFVARCWGLTSRQTTSTLGNISSVINYSKLLKGDVFNYPTSHVIIFVSKNSNGTYTCIEESAKTTGYRVGNSSHQRTNLKGYTPRKYKNAVALATTDIKDNNFASKYSINPTVTENTATIVSHESNYDIKLFNILGELVYSKQNASGNHTIDANSFKAGVYLVNITKDNVTGVIKIVKQ